jgi:hypothetical protein
VLKDTGAGLARGARFRPGGFIKNHFVTPEGKKMITVESRPGGSGAGYFSYPIAYEDIDELWKKYDRAAFVEIHLIHSSLAQKKRQIEELNKTVLEQAARIQRIEDMLRAAVRRQPS